MFHDDTTARRSVRWAWFGVSSWFDTVCLRRQELQPRLHLELETQMGELSMSAAGRWLCRILLSLACYWCFTIAPASAQFTSVLNIPPDPNSTALGCYCFHG